MESNLCDDFISFRLSFMSTDKTDNYDKCLYNDKGHHKYNPEQNMPVSP